jgi:hypothetical protein
MSIRHIAPIGVRHFFFSTGCACGFRCWSHLPPCGSAFCGVYTSTASSLRLLVPSGFLVRCKPIQIYHHHLAPVCGVRSSESSQCSMAPTLKLLVGSSFVLTLIFRSLMEVPTARSNSRVCPRVFRLPKYSSCILLRPLTLLPVALSFLRRSCFSVVPDVSSWTFVLSRLLLQHCPWAEYFRHFCLTVHPIRQRPLRYVIPARLAIHCGRRPTSSDAHYCPWSFSSVCGSALQLDSGPHVASSVFWEVSLRPLP